MMNSTRIMKIYTVGMELNSSGACVKDNILPKNTSVVQVIFKN